MPMIYKEDANGHMVGTYVSSTPAPKPAIVPTAPKVVATAPKAATAPTSGGASGTYSRSGEFTPALTPTTVPVASNAEQIAALQAQAAAQYAKVGSWSDPTITALHNQVVALQAGTGNAYNPTTGAWAPTTVTPAAVVPPVVPLAPVVAPPTALQQMMDLIAAQQQIAPPAYKQPDYSLIPQAQKGMAATANAADTTFLPTSHYNDRVASQKEAINAQANQAYNANLGSYNASQNAKQNQLANMASLLPYTEMTASQKATIEQGKIEANLDRQIQAGKDAAAAAADAEKTRQFNLTYGLDKQTTDYNTGKPYFAPTSGGSSSGGITPYQSYEINRNDQQDLTKITTQARDLANNDPRKMTAEEQQYLDAQNGELVQAYADSGYDSATSWQMAQADGRWKTELNGQSNVNDLYNAYLADLLDVNPSAKALYYQTQGVGGGNVNP